MPLSNADIKQIFQEFSSSQVADDDIFLFYNQNTGTTRGILASDFLSSTSETNFAWSSTQTYNTGDPVIYNGQWYISDIDNNTGNIPTDGPNWTLENKNTAITIKPWAAGIFDLHYMIVSEGDSIYRLRNSVTLPFNSQTTPSSDLTNWELLTTVFKFYDNIDAIGSDPTTLDVKGFDRHHASCIATTNLSINLDNTTIVGYYTLYIVKNTTENITVTFDDLSATVTDRYPNGAPNLLLSGASGSVFTINIQRLSGTLIISSDDLVLNEDNFSSDNAYQPTSQRSVKGLYDLKKRKLLTLHDPLEITNFSISNQTSGNLTLSISGAVTFYYNNKIYTSSASASIDQDFTASNLFYARGFQLNDNGTVSLFTIFINDDATTFLEDYERMYFLFIYDVANAKMYYPDPVFFQHIEGVGGSGGHPFKYDATVDPGVNNDINDSANASNGIGFEVGSKWLNTASGEWFLCTDNTDGAAVWEKVSLTIDELGALATLNEATFTELGSDVKELIFRFQNSNTINHSVEGALTLNFTGAKNKAIVNLSANVTTWTINGEEEKVNELIPFVIEFVQDGTGGHEPYTTRPSQMVTPDGVMPDFSYEANAKSRWYCHYNPTTDELYVLGMSNLQN